MQTTAPKKSALTIGELQVLPRSQIDPEQDRVVIWDASAIGTQRTKAVLIGDLVPEPQPPVDIGPIVDAISSLATRIEALTALSNAMADKLISIGNSPGQVQFEGDLATFNPLKVFLDQLR